MLNTETAAKVFLSYSHRDEQLLTTLTTHLKIMVRQGLIVPWHDRSIGAGSEWAGAIDANLEAADVILLLVSPDFLNSDYCWDVELARAIERHDAGEAIVIPIFLRHCDWHNAPFAKLQGLPQDAVPVTDRHWSSIDEAFTAVAKGIRTAIESRQKASQTSPKAIPVPAPVAANVAQPPAARPAQSTVVSDTGAWILLGEHILQAEQVDDGRDDRGQRLVTVLVTGASIEEGAHLRSLDPGDRSFRGPISFAYKEDGFDARVVSVSTSSVGGATTWTIRLAPDNEQQGGFGMEMAYNNLSADDLAELRARLLLLDEKPTAARTGDQFISSMLFLGDKREIRAGIFPALRAAYDADTPTFLIHARLLAVYYLHVTNTCEHVLELKLEPARNGTLQVAFRGRRRKVYTNVDPATIKVVGECSLA